MSRLVSRRENLRVWANITRRKLLSLLALDQTRIASDAWEVGSVAPCNAVVADPETLSSFIAPGASGGPGAVGVLNLGDAVIPGQEWLVRRAEDPSYDEPFPTGPMMKRLPWERCVETEFIGVHYSPPQEPTLTRRIDKVGNKGRRIGLHLDNWDRRPLGTRKESRQRFAINLGPGDRELLIVAQDVCGMLESALPPSTIPTTQDVRALCAKTGPWTILRIGIPAGFGYVAATVVGS